jgi:alginate O-acetyltransferase complex protein AlgJ
MYQQTSEPASAADSPRDRPRAGTHGPRRASQIFRKVTTDPQPSARARDVALIACFLFSVSLPLVGLVLSLDSGFAIDENRTRASRPRLTPDRKGLAEYPARLEAYFNDQFGFRARLIQWLNVAKVVALGVSPTPKVILGRDRWLFYGDLDIPYYRAVKPLTLVQLRAWQNRLEERQSWLARRGIRYLIVFAPLKSTVYPEYMPREYNRIRIVSRLDQLIAHLTAHSELSVIDLRAPILDEKARHQVYYRTDTHWNYRGSFVGYSQIARTLSRWFPQLEPIPISAFEETQYSEPGRDLALLLGMQPSFWERYVDLKMKKPPLARELKPGPRAGKLWTRGPDILYEHPDARLPRAVIFRDSFATWLIPLLSENFSRSLYSWQYTLDRELVERERPDVVIQEMVEVALMSSLVPAQ